jgi:hypothetical protein
MVVHVFCKRLFPMFHLFFRCMLQVCLFGCCICSTHMFQVFICMLHMCCNGFQVFHVFFASVLDACFKHFICCISLLALLSPPRLLLHCILLRLRKGCATGWWRGCEHTLSPFVMRAGSASVPSVFLLHRMLRWDGPAGGPQCHPTVQLAELRPNTLLVPNVRAPVAPCR